MSYTLTNYEDSGIMICTTASGGESGVSEAGLALNSNFTALAGLLETAVQNP